ncbi:MAG TPA: hypothetical protein VKY85_11210 [Candidatus Angelobacter sp.]|nr:hypothetical protein [Candidatus Angelobacter sp.]
MAITDGNAPLSNWQFRPTKLRAYEALQTMNRCFEATILSLERLDHLNVFRQEFLNAYKVTLEYTRAQANEELIQSLRGLEQHDTFRFGNMQDDWDKQYRDPDDVFFHARERRAEIQTQIRGLQRGLARQRPGKRKKR